jgi:RNA polymerase sigma-70 factor, ECF subfamily
MESEISEILAEWNDGNSAAFEKLYPLVTNELRKIARAHLRGENPNHTLQTTALINEAYLKLAGQKNVQWKNRAHFYAIASKVMRRVLLDYARNRLRDKRGGGAERLEFEEAAIISPEKSREIIALDEALDRLAKFDKLKSRIVELRYFFGLSVEETAEVLDIAPITVMRQWKLARAWLKREISAEKP